MGTCFSSTDWLVKDGKQEEFIARWTSFLTWTRETQDGLERVSLVVDITDPCRYVSLGEWRDPADRQAWQDDPRLLESSSLALRSAVTCTAARSCTRCLSDRPPSAVPGRARSVGKRSGSHLRQRAPYRARNPHFPLRSEAPDKARIELDIPRSAVAAVRPQPEDDS